MLFLWRRRWCSSRRKQRTYAPCRRSAAQPFPRITMFENTIVSLSAANLRQRFALRGKNPMFGSPKLLDRDTGSLPKDQLETGCGRGFTFRGILLPSLEVASLYLEVEQPATDNSGHAAFDR